MAEIKLTLRELNSEKETPINIIVRFNSHKLVYSSGKKVRPKFWESAGQKAVRSKEFAIKKAAIQQVLRWCTSIVPTAVLHTFFIGGA